MGVGLFVFRENIAKRLVGLVIGLRTSDREADPGPACLGWTWDVTLTLWHNPDWDISRARKSISRVVPPHPSPGFGLDSAICRSRRHQRHSGCFRRRSMLVALGLVQVLEPKIPALSSPRGRVAWILLKLALVYLLIAYTGGIQSNFWLLLLLPVVSAATASGLIGNARVHRSRRRRLPLLSVLPGWEKFVLERPEIEVFIQRAGLSVHGRQPRQRPRRSAARAIAKSAAASPSSWPRPTARCSRPTRPCAAPTGSPRWDSSPPGSRMNCAIPWAPSRRPPRCSDKQSQRGERSGARSGRLHLHRSRPHQLAGHPLSAIRAPARNSGSNRPTWRRCSTAPSPLAEREAAGIAIYQQLRSRRFRPSPSMPN